LLSTIVVPNRNAWRPCRAQAALAGTHGVKLFTIDQLAARLAGGFLQPVDGDHLAAAVAEAIKLPLGELDAVKALPRFQRAAASSLSKAWSAGLRLADENSLSKRPGGADQAGGDDMPGTAVVQRCLFEAKSYNLVLKIQ
jgi:hypothetical protein